MNRAVITKIEISNVKSYEKETILFNKGINVIGGLNGAGKSTIFESIGHCLFDVEARDFIGKADNFIRKGEKNYNITVFFTGIDNEEYKITRKAQGNRTLFYKAPSGWMVLDNYKNISNNNEDISEINKIVKKITGITANLELNDTFTEIIGPFQSDFLTPFLAKLSDRSSRFDQILGINQWKNLSKQTSSIARQFDSRISNLRARIEEREKETAILPEKEIILAQSIKTKIDLENNQKDLQQQKEEIEKTIRQMEEKQKSLENKIREKTNAQSEWEKKSISLHKEKENLEAARQSAKIVGENAEAHRIYEEQEKLREELQKKYVELNKLEKLISELESGIKNAETDIAAKKEAAEKNRKANLDEIAHHTAKSLIFENDIKISSESENTAQEKLNRILDYKNEISGFDYSPIKSAIDSIKPLLSKIGDLKRSIENRRHKLTEKQDIEQKSSLFKSLEEKMESITTKISTSEALLKNAQNGREALKGGSCPFMGEKCLNLGDRDPGAFFDEEIEKLSAQIKELEKEKKETEKLKTEAQKAGVALVGLIKEEGELQKEKSQIAQTEDSIRQTLTKQQIQDLCDSLSHTLKRSTNQESTSILNMFEKNVSEFSFPQDINDYPMSLTQLNNHFTSARNETLVIVEKEESDARTDLQKAQKDHNTAKTEHKNCLDSIKSLNKKNSNLDDEQKQLDDREKKLEGEKTLLAEEKAKLTPYTGTKDNLDQCTNIIELNKDGHNKYVRNKESADQVDNYTSKVDVIKQELEEAKSVLDRTASEAEELAKQFDKNELDKNRELFTKLVSDLNVCKNNIEHKDKEIKDLESEITRLRQIIQEIESVRQEADEYEKSKNFAENLRKQVLDKIAAKVSTHLRADISSIAKDIYREISGQNEILNWGDSYQIELIDYIPDPDGSGSTKRIRFDRQLSGGQMMTAVIAIRLALLMKIGSSIAFFDEPTSNLDEERRKKLAETFRNLKSNWYSQLFLVSHDESFQGITGNYIELTLENGKTKVISGHGLKSSIANVRTKVTTS